MAMRVVSMVLAMVLVACTTEAFKIETYNPASCDGTPTNTFFVNGPLCTEFNDQGAVHISEVSADTRVSIHNQRDCAEKSIVAQIHGPGCVVQGATKLRSVFIQGFPENP